MLEKMVECLGVIYRYSDSDLADNLHLINLTDDEITETLKKLPVELVSEVGRAVSDLNPKRIKMALESLEPLAPDAIRTLAGMADNFEYKRIINLLGEVAVS